jgi:LemA protein
MAGFFSFIIGIFEFLIFIGIVLAVIAFLGYNKLRALSETIRECWSNIGVVGKKQASLLNQLIDVVKGYQESEKLVVLKVSDDMSSANQLAQMHQQSGMVLSAVGGMAQRFPELKSNQQYQRLIDSIQSCEAQLESARQRYTASVKGYNVERSSIPHVFYASTLGFKNAHYLELDGASPIMEADAIKSFSSDQDGEHLKKLLGNAGSALMDAGNKVLDESKVIASAAQEKIKQLQEIKQSQESKSPSDKAEENELIMSPACPSCNLAVTEGSVFCSGCGTKIAV